MVSSRHGRSAVVNGYSTGANSNGYKDDIETGTRRNMRSRFKDVVNSVIEDGRRLKMKKKLLEGMERDALEGYRKTQSQLDEIETKKVRQFYEDQNSKLDDWLEVDMVVRSIADDIIDSFDPGDEDGDGVPDRDNPLCKTDNAIEPYLPEEEREKRRKADRNARYAININVLANVVLLGAKIVAAFFSSSLSLIASLVDSALDLLCTLIIWTTGKLVQRKIKGLNKRFPIGRRRLEPIGILVFSIIMIVSFLQILQESVKKLLPAPGKIREADPLPPAAIGAMVGTIVVKGILWIGCHRIKTTQVQALAQDCKTDVVFNSFSLAFPLIGYYAGIWWLDPVGAGLLSLNIIFDWASTMLENVARLTGIGVSDDLFKKLLYLTWRFSPVVASYKSITAYHAGDGVWCEVDLLLDEKTPLEHAHDLSETLQYCLEGLPEVDRAFVTCDYKMGNPNGHGANMGE